MDKVEKTGFTFGFLWSKSSNVPALERWHFNAMQEVINEPIVSGSIGIDVGCGLGYDTYLMAKNNPRVEVIGVDISQGVDNAKRITSGLSNVGIIKCSILDMPVKNEIFDFAYSFGVLHHTPDPKRCLLEISRILKNGKPVYVYLYEDHSNNFVKYAAIKVISWIRRITVRVSPKIIYFFCWILSPAVFIIFTVPAKIMMGFKYARDLAGKIPFSFGKGLFSLRGDLYDRFSAPIEYRFNRQGLYDMFTECGFSRVNITKLNGIAGWVVWGYKS